MPTAALPKDSERPPMILCTRAFERCHLNRWVRIEDGLA
jgi:hypothetical protein